jgi:hypothetical protein
MHVVTYIHLRHIKKKIHNNIFLTVNTGIEKMISTKMNNEHHTVTMYFYS